MEMETYFFWWVIIEMETDLFRPEIMEIPTAHNKRQDRQTCKEQ
jgi:hypothetical protein